LAADGTRRTELLELATDYALEHGLIGLSLRPLAAAAGTSDRMLLYHFADKDDLVASVLRTSNDRSVEVLRALPPAPGVREGVWSLWAAVTAPGLDRCQRLYVEAAALGLLGREPYVTVVQDSNERWVAAVADHLRAAGTPDPVARRAALLVDATFMGLQLDLPLDRDSSEREVAVRDLGDAVAVIAGLG